MGDDADDVIQFYRTIPTAELWNLRAAFLADAAHVTDDAAKAFIALRLRAIGLALRERQAAGFDRRRH